MNGTKNMTRLATGLWTLPLALSIALTGCGGTNAQATDTSTEGVAAEEETATERTAISDDTDNGHAIAVSGEQASYTATDVTKTGEADGDEADFYGTNAAVYAEEGATLALDDITVTTNGTHANAVFSYGEGTTVTIANSTIDTTGNCSGGIMVTGGGTLEATDLTVHTTGNSSAAIRSDRGGGTQNVTGGTYTTDGTGSPVIYSTADVTVHNAKLTSTASQGVVVEGKNSVTLDNVELTASNTTKNSDKSDWYQAVMIYQSMSGDAAEGEASFTMNGGSLTNTNGDVFFVNNTVATINLSEATITNQDANGVLARLAAAGWGSEGSNGGHVTLNASKQTLDGDIVVDSVSELNMYLKEGSTYTGAINAANEGTVYVEIESGSTWKLTGDSYVSALTCDADAIDLNGHTLYVNGEAYTEGTASNGSAIEFTLPESTGGPGGMPGEGGPGGAGGEPPAKPDGTGGPGGAGGEPPAKPGE
ncbi:MAG: hypothetical protein IJI12_04955 [Atopobiaceae bacterium]|nr:hypothetical protein [Atopobiaceae bacterium]